MKQSVRLLRSIVVTLCIGALFMAPAGPADAAAGASLLEGVARELPRVGRVAVELRPVELAPLQAAKYGLPSTDAAIVTLDNAKAGEVTLVDTTAQNVAADPEAADFIKGCSKGAFKKAAQDYARAAQNGTAFPSFDDSFYYELYGCLEKTFPRARSDAVNMLAGYLTGHADQSAQQVATTRPMAFANWLATTGDEVGPVPVADNTQSEPPAPAPAPPAGSSDGGGSSGGGGSSFPWLLVVLGAVALGAIVLFRNSKRP